MIIHHQLNHKQVGVAFLFSSMGLKRTIHHMGLTFKMTACDLCWKKNMLVKFKATFMYLKSSFHDSFSRYNYGQVLDSWLLQMSFQNSPDNTVVGRL